MFVERLWRSIKYEEVYLHGYESVSDAKAAIARYIEFYNSRRPHSSLDKKTPDEFASPPWTTPAPMSTHRASLIEASSVF